MSFHVTPESVVYQITALYLRKEADKILTVSQKQDIEGWLKQWTCIRNFQALITTVKVDALAAFRREITRTVSSHKWPPEAFEFEMDSVPVKKIEGEWRMWLTTLTTKTLDVYPVVFNL